jgi:hypothetical protein
MVLIPPRAVDRPVAARLEGHLSFLAAASTGRSEHLARRALPDERSPPRSALRPLSAIRAAAGRIAEAATGVILLRADGEDELADRNRGRSASYQMACAAVPQVNRQPLAWPSSEFGFRRNQRNRLFSEPGQCILPHRRTRAGPSVEPAAKFEAVSDKALAK